ncbi:uncharacterized protein BJ212DRAFT_1261662, partial [Suillus subaureus]
WKEEMILVQLEIDWTCNFFLWKATQWGDWMRESLVKCLPGHACYSGRQSQMYSLLAQDALGSVSRPAEHVNRCSR